MNEQQYTSHSDYKQNYSEKYTNNVDSYNGRSYGRNSPIYKSTTKSSYGGASAVKVQPVPDGVLGQPVEFESEYQFNLNYQGHAVQYNQVFSIIGKKVFTNTF